MERLLLIVCEGSRVAEKIVEGLCSGVCSNSTLTGIAIDIVYLYTHFKEPQPTESFRQPSKRASSYFNLLTGPGCQHTAVSYSNDRRTPLVMLFVGLICHMPACSYPSRSLALGTDEM